MTSRMFSMVKVTWNPVVGCTHNCCYCWARRLARRQKNRCKKCYRFVPHLHPERLNRRFKNKIVFVVDMGDLFCYEVPDTWIIRVLHTIEKNPDSRFLLLTKNPLRYFDFLELFPSNVILGATIESDRDWDVSDAPHPMERLLAMKKLPWDDKFIAIEPILDFNNVFVDFLEKINPRTVYVGYDNYNHKLPEPELEKTKWLVSELKKFTNVNVKTLRKAWWEK